MKKGVVIGLILIAALMLFAETEQLSKVKQFQTQTGDLIVKEFHTIGVVKGTYGTKLEISVLKMTRTNGNSTIKGLRITGIKPSSYGDDTSVAFLDIDEITSLIDALIYMQGVKQRVGEDKSLPYTEYEFAAKDGFQIGFYISKGEYTGYSKVGTIGAISVFLGYNDLPAVLGHVQSAKALLDTL